jgi:plastocyanin
VFGNAAAERAAIERTYEDTMEVTRVEKITGSNHITKKSDAVIYSDIICGLSLSGGNNSGQTDAQQDVDHDAVVFAPPDLEIKPGDGITLTRFGRDDPSAARKRVFEVVGRPNVYATHQEIEVKEGDLA